LGSGFHVRNSIVWKDDRYTAIIQLDSVPVEDVSVGARISQVPDVSFQAIGLLPIRKANGKNPVCPVGGAIPELSHPLTNKNPKPAWRRDLSIGWHDLANLRQYLGQSEQ